MYPAKYPAKMAGFRGAGLSAFTESVVEEAALSWFQELGYEVAYGPDMAFDGLFPERAGYADVVLAERLKKALASINPHLPAGALADAAGKVIQANLHSPNLTENNRRFQRFLTDGVPVEYRLDEGRIVYDSANLIDFAVPENNDWLVVNQFTVIEQTDRRPDMVVFVNGMPLGVVELKNPADEDATLEGAFKQIQTYKNEIPSLFASNAVAVISDGLAARAGTLTSGWEWFMPWRTIDGTELVPKDAPTQLGVLIPGIFAKSRFLDMLRNFIVFEDDGFTVSKKMAGYHQFHAVNRAIERTITATALEGDKRAGVVWHTQGSGKSLTMTFYAGKLVRDARMANPTLVVLTDRNDLDGQLFGKFAACLELLGQNPVQAENRYELRELLSVASGGIVFTTIQKFFPETKGDTFPTLSERRNIVVIADEAHRSQYDFIHGFARHTRDALPNASFIGFTGTPIEHADRNTPAVFGDYIDIYPIEQAVEDGATVPIYYEARMAKIELDEVERPKIDPDFEEVTESEEQSTKDKLKSKWARLEAMVGTKQRVELVAKDIVDHFEKRLEAMDGKAMIVCMSRRICVDLHEAIVKLRPDWYDSNDAKGIIKVVMTGSATDGPAWQEHIRNKARRDKLSGRFRDAADAFKVVIVRDMWLTGFDAPSLHTMYLDKPMRGHGLMQTITRVNRVFRDKPGGLIVDYLGIAAEMKKALAEHTEGDQRQTGIDQAEAVALLLEKYETAQAFFHGLDYAKFFTGTPAERTNALAWAVNHILEQEEGKERFLQVVGDLSKAFALSVPHEQALAIRDDVGFFQAVRGALPKVAGDSAKSREELETAIRQIVSRAVAPAGVVDIFSAAGLKRPDISILSDEFLEDARRMPQKNLALEMLKRLLTGEIRTFSRKNLVQSRSFAEMLEKTIVKYQNRTIEAAQVIAELIELAKDMKRAYARGEVLGLTDDELAFYDALGVNDSAVKVLGDEALRTIASEIVQVVRNNTATDWNIRESARANLRRLVKRVLRKYGYPPDKQEQATLTVLEQAELLAG